MTASPRPRRWTPAARPASRGPAPARTAPTIPARQPNAQPGPSPVAQTRRCRACGRTRPVDELLVVTRRQRPELAPTFVCRPTVYHRGDPFCAATLGPAYLDAIAPAATVALIDRSGSPR